MPSNRAALADRAVTYFGAMQKIPELARLIQLVQARLRPGQAIVEIGSAAGGSLLVWNRLSNFVVGIDLPNGPFGGARRDRLQSWGAKLIRGDSHDQMVRAELVKMLAGRRVGFLFIDGDHSYAGAKADFEDYAPLVVSGGLVALHDICEHERSDVDVARLWLELRGRYRSEEIVVKPTTWGGIGVLHVP